MPSEAMVIPSWQAERYSSIASICRSDERRAALALVAHLSIRPLARAHQGELGRDEVAVEGHQHEHASRSDSSVISDLLPWGVYFEDLVVIGGRGRVARVTRARSIFFASSKSFSVSPPSEWVLIVDRHLAPGDRQIGVVVHLLGPRRDRVDELDRAAKSPRRTPWDRVAIALPAVEALQPLLDLLVAQKCHRLPVRIASLVPSATEMLFALGLGDDVVAVTHECDFPPEARSMPHLTRSVIPEGSAAAEIDRAVRERTEPRRGRSTSSTRSCSSSSTPT